VVRGLGNVLVPHEVRDNDADAPNLVIEHDGSAAVLAAAQLEWTVGVLGVERLTGEALGVGHVEVAVLEEDNVGRWLLRHRLAHAAVAHVVVDWLSAALCRHVSAATLVLCARWPHKVWAERLVHGSAILWLGHTRSLRRCVKRCEQRGRGIGIHK